MGQGGTNIDIIRRYPQHWDFEVTCDSAQVEPALAVVHKTNTNTDPTKPPCTSDAMEIRLWVWSTAYIGR